MNKTLDVLMVWLIVAAGIQLGTLWIMKLSILPMLNSLRYDSYVTTCQLIDMHAFHPIAVWNGVIAAGLSVAAAVMTPSATISALFALGALGMVGVGIASEGFNRPLWRQIEKWSPERVAADWTRKRAHWHIAHQVRTYAAIGSVGAYTAAVLVHLV